MRQAKAEIVTASKVAYRYFLGVTSNSIVAPADSADNSNGSTPRFQANWFKNLASAGAKPSGSSELENGNEDVLQQQRRRDVEAPLHQNSVRDT